MGQGAGAVGNKTATSPWRIRANGGHAWHGCRGWLARVPRMAVGGDAYGVAPSKTEEEREWLMGGARLGIFIFLIFFWAVTHDLHPHRIGLGL